MYLKWSLVFVWGGFWGRMSREMAQRQLIGTFKLSGAAAFSICLLKQVAAELKALIEIKQKKVILNYFR